MEMLPDKKIGLRKVQIASQASERSGICGWPQADEGIGEE
jgi:hypothetical protein